MLLWPVLYSHCKLVQLCFIQDNGYYIHIMRPEAYESILVSCPVPAHQRMGEMTVAQVRLEMPDIAERIIDPILSVAAALEKSGMDEREAVDMAFKAVAVIDETGGIKRADLPEAELQVAESKKK